MGMCCQGNHWRLKSSIATQRVATACDTINHKLIQHCMYAQLSLSRNMNMKCTSDSADRHGVHYKLFVLYYCIVLNGPRSWRRAWCQTDPETPAWSEPCPLHTESQSHEPTCHPLCRHPVTRTSTRLEYTANDCTCITVERGKTTTDIQGGPN